MERWRGGDDGLWARFRAMPTRAHVALGVLLVIGALALPDTDEPDPDVEVVVGSATAGDDAAARAAAREAAERRAAAAAAEAEAAEEAARAEDAAAARAEAEAEAEEVARAAEEAASATWTVHHVVDGDTVDVRRPDGTEERVRVVGIDTPERGECGFGAATSAMVELVPGARDDRDRYDRILRYVDVDGVDAGLALIERGLAVARYDSRDGYGRHDREDAYVAADAATPHVCPSPSSPDVTTSGGATSPSPSGGGPGTGPGTGPGGAWRNCTEAREAGAAPVHRGQPGYGEHLDRDRDGIGCE